jgi:hypothetical protein
MWLTPLDAHGPTNSFGPGGKPRPLWVLAVEGNVQFPARSAVASTYGVGKSAIHREDFGFSAGTSRGVRKPPE